MSPTKHEMTNKETFDLRQNSLSRKSDMANRAALDLRQGAQSALLI
jgi:hypothetical protein